MDSDLAAELEEVLQFLVAWSAAQGVEVRCRVVTKDFVLEHAAALEGMRTLFRRVPCDGFDVVVSNPPYFKLNKTTDPRAKAAASIVHGQPNIYSLFMAIGTVLVRESGNFIYITPRSFASGPYFRAFRERFFDLVRPEFVHVFGSRRDAFSRDEVLQENVIIKGVRDDRWPESDGSGTMTISSSHGISDLEQAERRSVRLGEILDWESRDKILRLPATRADAAIVGLVEGWTGSLAAYGLRISTGPVVPFRARSLNIQ